VNVISAWEDIMSGFDFSYLLGILLGVIPSLLCITLHELSHGYVAYKLGDTTAKDMGRLTLNPLKHLDPMGLLMMLVFHVGWAKPVPVNMNRFRDPKKGMAITALAGPASNVLITLVFLAFYGALYIPLMQSTAGSYLLQMIALTARMSIGLAIFNLLPIPPLDGSKILFSLLPENAYRTVLRFERYSSLLLFALMALGVLGKPLSALINASYNALFPVAEAAFDLIRKLFYR
jgi:Zn-dependent protease